MANSIHDISIRGFTITPDNHLEIELGEETLDLRAKAILSRLQRNARMALSAIDATKAMLASPENSGPFYDTYKHLGMLIIKDYEAIDELMSSPVAWLEAVKEAMHEEVDRDFRELIHIAEHFSHRAWGARPSGEYVTPDFESPEVTS